VRSNAYFYNERLFRSANTRLTFPFGTVSRWTDAINSLFPPPTTIYHPVATSSNPTKAPAPSRSIPGHSTTSVGSTVGTRKRARKCIINGARDAVSLPLHAKNLQCAHPDYAPHMVKGQSHSRTPRLEFCGSRTCRCMGRREFDEFDARWTRLMRAGRVQCALYQRA
jgi:hypothetical protein